MSTAISSQPLAPPASPLTEPAHQNFRSLQIIPLTQIVASRTNPRKNFEGPEFDELVASVRQVGVLQPVLVRPKIDDIGFELVAGERRFRAAAIVGLTAIQANVRELTDAQALEAQIIENRHRKDVSALEEAEAFLRLVESVEAEQKSKPITDRQTRGEIVQTIADRIGKSVRFVWSRMKLVNLAPEVKAALEAGKIEASHADVLVTLAPSVQKDVLEHDITDFDGELRSVRGLKEIIESDYATELKKAPWKWQKDTAINPLYVWPVGTPVCLGCEQNTASVEGVDPKSARCLNTDCLNLKKKHFVAGVAKKAEEISGGKLTKVIDSYFDGYKKKGILLNGQWVRAAMGSCEFSGPVAVVHDDGSIEKVVNACKEKKCKTHFAKGSNSEPVSAAKVEQERKRQLEEERGEAQDVAVLKAAVSKVRTLGPMETLRLMDSVTSDIPDSAELAICEMFDLPSPEKNSFKSLCSRSAKRVNKLSDADRVKLLIMCSLANDLGEWMGSSNIADDYARKNGIDPKKVRENAGKEFDDLHAPAVKPTPTPEQLASIADPKKPAAKKVVKKVSPSVVGPKAASPKKSTKSASQAKAKKSTKKGGR